MRKIGLVGAGYIAHVHAEVLRIVPNVQLQAVTDVQEGAARDMAQRWGITRVAASIEDMIAAGDIDCAHVLTPPHLHLKTALPFLEAGIPVLLEKPLAASSEETRILQSVADARGAVLGVNQNFVYHPMFLRLRQTLNERTLGKPTFVSCLYNVALRQMAARQFGHWMFAKPGNILLEQAVHPLSQIAALTGSLTDVKAMAGSSIEISPGVPFYDSVTALCDGEKLQAQLRFAVGQNFPFWQITAVCDDGVAVADILNNRFFTYERTKWLEFYDAFLSGSHTAGSIMGHSLRGAGDYVLSTAKVKPRIDSFFLSMKGSIEAFHQALDAGKRPELDGAFGAHLVDVCERIAVSAGFAGASPVAVKREGDYDVAVLGGTGFIGSHVVRRLLSEGRKVGVMARNTTNLDPVFADERVVMVGGDVRRQSDVERAIGNAKIVVNLAHGGGGKNYEEVRAAMVGSAEIVARACLARNVERLIHIGSIASLYLGPEAQQVTGATSPDERAELRADYARAKAECDRMLMTMHTKEGLPVCLLRPGLVVGKGGLPFHSGLGFFNNDQHCVGWNSGKNPLPFVLVEDVASAVWQACQMPAAIGHAYNLVGDVRLTARDYMRELGTALERPLQFHPKSTTVLWLQEVGKWLVKVAVGRKSAIPAKRDFLSRGLEATFDCADVKRDLGWSPVADRQQFIERAIRVYVR